MEQPTTNSTHHDLGPFARLGRACATHVRLVWLAWAVVLVLFGAFAPSVQHALAGAGWQDSQSQSVRARAVIERDFGGLGATALEVVVVDRDRAIAEDPRAEAIVAEVAALLHHDHRVAAVELPMAGTTLAADGRTGIVVGGAASNSNAMVEAAQSLFGPLHRLSTSSISVTLTGSSALWANFNEVNHAAMLHSEVLSWPVTLAILLVAFGGLVAAGLPLLLTMVGLLVAAGSLVLLNHAFPISIWALNFALMFALALGIDYALFVVMRFRQALERRGVTREDRAGVVASVAETVDTAGKAVAFSAVTVLASLGAIVVVPSPAFRSMALGIMLSVVAVLAATLTLLPAVLASLGTRVNAGALRRPTTVTSNGETRLDRGLHRLGRTMWRHPAAFAALGLVVLVLAALPALHLRTNMPSITIVPASSQARVGYDQVTAAFGPGAPGTLQVVVPEGEQAAALAAMRATAGVAGVVPGPSAAGWSLDQVVPATGPSTLATEQTITALRRALPRGSLVGGAAAENADLQRTLGRDTPLVFGILLAMGFVLLLVALGAPLIAAAGVLLTAFSVAGAFGVATLIFQDGHLASLLNFEPQGFVDAWGPLFFGAMVFGVAMDYTLFMLSTAKESYETHVDPEHAMVGSVRTSGRVVLSAAVVMVAVFLTFALSGPLAPKEMGVILAAAVALDAFVVRMVLLPVVLRYGRHHAWRQPKVLAKLLPTVRFSH